jgi:hypothetical protein
MNRHKKVETLSQFIDLAENLQFQRYRLAIACGEISSGKSKIAQAASEQLPACYINLATDLLSQITAPDFSPTLGAYAPDNLTEWLLHKADQMDVQFLIIDQIEPLLATFGRAQTVQFFQMVSRAEPRKPVVLVTYLRKQIEEAGFPIERILHL